MKHEVATFVMIFMAVASVFGFAGGVAALIVRGRAVSGLAVLAFGLTVEIYVLMRHLL